MKMARRAILEMNPFFWPGVCRSRSSSAPIAIGAGLFAEKKFGPQLHLLDDGFQHRRLPRDFDIVLVSQDDFAEPFCRLGVCESL